MSPKTLYLDCLLAAIGQAAEAIPAMVEAADKSAERLVAGGDLYAASVRPDFVSEAFIRSGGMMMLQAFDDKREPGASDVVIVSWSSTSGSADVELIRRLKETGAFIVGIGPPRDELIDPIDLLVPNNPLAPTPLTDTFGGESYPLTSVHNLVLLWAFTGELVAALTRLGTMPAMFQSVLVPGARERNEGVGTKRFHQSHSVPPIAASDLAAAYLSEIATCLGALRDRQVGVIGEAAKACADVIARGSHIHAFLISHFPCHQAGAPGDLGFMRRLDITHGETPDLAELQDVLQSGDLFFFLGYYRRPVPAYELARRRGCRIVEVITGTDEAATDESALSWPVPDYVIEPGWPYTDALVTLPGYDIRILPASGIVQTAIYWTILAGITQHLNR